MNHPARGFTLIELSIVLVIIGLIVGGVLAGRELIKAAEARAQITQIEKYQIATNTFKGKYGYLPGDIREPDASRFGFAARGASPHQGDGNGVIDGLTAATSQDGGETLMFWSDLTYANGLKVNLVEGNFSKANPSISYVNLPPFFNLITGSGISGYLPQAKLGNGNYVYVWNGGVMGGDNANYYTISAIYEIDGNELDSNLGLTPNEAYAIDKKMDDGMPQSGRVTAVYHDSNNCNTCYAAGGGNGGLSDNNTGGPVTNPGNASGETNSIYTCYDYPNPLSPSVPLIYSVASNGTQQNCALSFGFQ